MTEFGEVRPGARIFVLILLIIVLTLGGIVWFDYLGILEARSFLAPVYSLFGLQRRTETAAADDPNLLEKERLAKQAESLSLREEDVTAKTAELDKREKELAQLAEDLKDREEAATAKEKAFNESVNAFENRRVNLVQNSTYLTSMSPKNAVAILVNMEDQDIIDIFRITDDQAKAAGEDSVVPYWLAQMPADRAAVLQRKMSRKSGG